MNHRHAKTRALLAAYSLLSEAARNSEIFDNDGTPEEDVHLCRHALARLADEMWDRASKRDPLPGRQAAEGGDHAG